MAAQAMETHEMNAVAPREQTQVAGPDADSLMTAIIRAATDTTVDIERFRALMAMRKELEVEQAEREFDAAMSACQQAMEPVRTNAKNIQTKSTYADYAALDAALRPIYTTHGFSLTFNTAEGAPEGHVRIVAKIAHAGGHRERPHIDMPADGKGAKGGDVMTKTHATGSAITYGRRYLLGMIFNIAVGKDDDGNGASDAGSNEPINSDQVKEIRRLIEETGADIEKFCAYLKVESIPEITERRFPAAIAALKAKGRK